MKLEDGTSTWENLSTMIKSSPIMMAKYALENKLLSKHVWRSFIGYAKDSKKFNRLMNQVQLNAKSFPGKKTYKFGVQIPRNYKEALKFDEDNNNKFWKESI